MHLRTFLTPAFFQLNLFSYLALKVRCLLEFMFVCEFYNVKVFKIVYCEASSARSRIWLQIPQLLAILISYNVCLIKPTWQ